MAKRKTGRAKPLTPKVGVTRSPHAKGGRLR